MEKVSIIVPVYNVEKYLTECIESILCQTYPNIEIIMVEDKSLDKSLEVAKRYEHYSNVVLLENGENKGVGYSRNRGIRHATGNYIMFVDSDDILTPVAVEYLVKALEGGKTSIAMCQYSTFLSFPKRKVKKLIGNFEIVDLEKEDSLLGHCQGYCWNKLYKKELFEQLRFPEGICYEDVAFNYPIMIAARYISYIPEPLYQYRFNFSGITKTNKRVPNRGLLDLYAASLVLDQNYRLVRRNGLLDEKMRQIGHNTIFIASLDSSFWLSMKNKNQLSNLFLQLANLRYGYVSYHDNPVIETRAKKVPHYRIRIKYFDRFIHNKKYELVGSNELEIVQKINDCFDEEASSRSSRCKQKVKRQ